MLGMLQFKGLTRPDLYTRLLLNQLFSFCFVLYPIYLSFFLLDHRLKHLQGSGVLDLALTTFKEYLFIRSADWRQLCFNTHIIIHIKITKIVLLHLVDGLCSVRVRAFLLVKNSGLIEHQELNTIRESQISQRFGNGTIISS